MRMMLGCRKLVAGFVGLLLVGCGPAPEEAAAPPAQAVAQSGSDDAPELLRNPERTALFGDLHVHTQYSFDAFVFGTRTTPDDAYRFARGEAIEHPAGFQMQLERPLDFQAVTDHASYLGMLLEMNDPGTRAGKHPMAEVVRGAVTPEGRTRAFQEMVGYFGGRLDGTDLLDMDVVRSAWRDIIDAAEQHNDPGSFTTFIGYEYTASGDERENLHRNVIFSGSAAPDAPFSRLDSGNPEQLWSWLDELRDEGIEALAIPHNSNGSDGMMFEMTQFDGSPIDAEYAELRLRNEPLVEVTQVKGTSETHPALSPNDEWAGFEIMNVRIATTLPSTPAGSYVRDAYLRGLTLEETVGANPYRFGMAGASDTHVSAGSFDESNYWSKVGMVDATPELRGSVPQEVVDDEPRYADTVYSSWGASGLTGVWAEANTREDIYAAFRRKETFATSGPRIRVRFFGGFDIAGSADAQLADLASVYASMVPMGGELNPRGAAAPVFLIWAARDADSVMLDRLQVIKGFVRAGEARERVYDVACAGAAVVDGESQRCPPTRAGVDVDSCRVSEGAGSPELKTLWRDPDYDPEERAFYYVRVLENPTCRWSTWDALARGVAPRDDLPATIQERAWTSPIWLAP